jgi:hypothetical protein
LIHKHQVLLILGFRFLYGLRTVTPLVLGASRIAPLRFLILNMLGALAWTIVIGIMGYLFGHTLEVIIGDVKRYELWLFIGLAAFGVMMRAARLLKKNEGQRGQAYQVEAANLRDAGECQTVSCRKQWRLRQQDVDMTGSTGPINRSEQTDICHENGSLDSCHRGHGHPEIRRTRLARKQASAAAHRTPSSGSISCSSAFTKWCFVGRSFTC